MNTDAPQCDHDLNQESYLMPGKYGSKKKDGLTKHQRYYARHKEKMIAQNKEYREKNSEQYNAYMRQYRKENPEIIKKTEKNRNRTEEHIKKFNKYRREWAKKNPDKELSYYHKRRSRTNGGHIPEKKLTELRKKQKGLCFYCKNKLDNNGRGHLDHKTPLSRGGKHEINNVVFACSSCNLRKATKTADEFLSASCVEKSED